MIKTTAELNLKVNAARLLTRQELMDFEDQLPDISMGCCWWLNDEDEFGDIAYIAYAEGNYTDDDMYCSKYEANTWLRVALDIEGDINAGDEFVYRGYVFTVLSDDLAISNNFLGCVKYLDEDLIDEDEECTIDAVIATMINDCATGEED